AAQIGRKVLLVDLVPQRIDGRLASRNSRQKNFQGDAVGSRLGLREQRLTAGCRLDERAATRQRRDSGYEDSRAQPPRHASGLRVSRFESEKRDRREEPAEMRANLGRESNQVTNACQWKRAERRDQAGT